MKKKIPLILLLNLFGIFIVSNIVMKINIFLEEIKKGLDKLKTIVYHCIS